MIIVTHDGSFHLDDVLSTAILKMLYPIASIKRTRNMEEIEKGDIVYDVGGIYDKEKLRFDHHQRGFSEQIRDVKLSSAGLIYRHFYKDLFKMYGINKENPYLEFLYYEIYDEYFMYVDAIDNGIDLGEKITPRTLAGVVGSYNYSKNGFKKAVKFMKKDLNRYLKFKLGIWAKELFSAGEIVQNVEGEI